MIVGGGVISITGIPMSVMRAFHCIVWLLSPCVSAMVRCSIFLSNVMTLLDAVTLVYQASVATKSVSQGFIRHIGCYDTGDDSL